jgi:8-oxo-dGTP pyrophosphatase MutT (NUDIX family)
LRKAKNLLSGLPEFCVIEKFPVSVKAVIVRDGKFLMLKSERKGPDGFSFPGGLVEKGESLEEALVREVKEETGLEVNPGKVFYSEKYIHPLGSETIGVYFSSSLLGGKIALGSEADHKFVSLDWVLPKDAPPWARNIMMRRL